MEKKYVYFVDHDGPGSSLGPYEDRKIAEMASVECLKKDRVTWVHIRTHRDDSED